MAAGSVGSFSFSVNMAELEWSNTASEKNGDLSDDRFWSRHHGTESANGTTNLVSRLTT